MLLLPPRSTLFPYTTLFRSGQVMRNEQIRHPQRALQFHQEVGDLRLHRTIESRKRLIQNQELRLEGQCASDGQPLARSEEHTSELQSRRDLVCRLLLEKKKK